MKKIEVPKCIHNERFHIAVTDQNKKTTCSTKFVSTGNIDINGKEIYVFIGNQLNNCAQTRFDASKLTVKIETISGEHPGWKICLIRIKRVKSTAAPPRGNFYNPESK